MTSAAARRGQEVSTATDPETRFLRFIGHRIPALPHASALANRVLKPFYLRKPRAAVTCNVLGRFMELDPAEAVDGNLLFCPQLYDAKEVGFLLDHLAADSTFVDVGAHKGFYALMASKRILSGRILAIEADPATFTCLQRNVALNDARIEAVNRGVSDREETLLLHVQVSGNKGGSSFLGCSAVQVPVACSPLAAIVGSAGLERITAMKLDIEGFEHRVLQAFFRQAPRSLHPRYLIAELNPDSALSTGDLGMLLASAGYRHMLRTSLNGIYERLT